MKSYKILSGLFLLLLPPIVYSYDLNKDGYLDIVFLNNSNDTNRQYKFICILKSLIKSTKTLLPTMGAFGVSAGNMSAFGQNYIEETTAVPEPLSVFLLLISEFIIFFKKGFRTQ